MAESSQGFFGLPEHPLSDWLANAARERASKRGIDFATAFSQIGQENPRTREGSRLEAIGSADAKGGSAFLQLMRRAIEMRTPGLSEEEAMERAAAQDRDLARRARRELGGSLYAAEPTTGCEGKPAGQELAAKAKQRMIEEHIDFHTAFREIATEEPDLHAAYNAEVLHDHCGRQYAAERGSGANFSETNGGREVIPGAFVDRPKSWALHKKVYTRAVEKKIPYSQAKREIEMEEPELAEAAAGESGMQIKDIKALPDGRQMIICNTELGLTADPNGLFAEVVSKRAKRKCISHGRAIAEVRRDYPKLARARDAEVMQSR